MINKEELLTIQEQNKQAMEEKFKRISVAKEEKSRINLLKSKFKQHEVNKAKNKNDELINK